MTLANSMPDIGLPKYYLPSDSTSCTPLIFNWKHRMTKLFSPFCPSNVELVVLGSGILKCPHRKFVSLDHPFSSDAEPHPCRWEQGMPTKNLRFLDMVGLAATRPTLATCCWSLLVASPGWHTSICLRVAMSNPLDTKLSFCQGHSNELKQRICLKIKRLKIARLSE